MDILINVGISFLLGLVSLYLTLKIEPHSHSVLATYGRINRFQFIISILFLSATMHIFNMFIQQLLTIVVILPAYFAIKALAYAGYIIFLPFYYTLYIRRLNDIGLPGRFIGILLGMYILCTNLYIPLKNIYILHLIIVYILHGFLACFPGSNGSNRYGSPTHWPSRKSKKG